MRWLSLIGKRLLDFIITSSVMISICLGVAYVGHYYRAEYRSSAQEGGKINKEFLDNVDRELERIIEVERRVRNTMYGVSIIIGLFGVISILGIVFRREGLTQREGFVRVWVGVPKYFAGYFKKSNTGDKD